MENNRGETELRDDLYGGNSGDALAKALSSTLSGILLDFDSKAQAAIKGQESLTCAIDRLTRELDRLLEDAPIPLIMQQAAKISQIRKRVAALNLALKNIQDRIDHVDRKLFARENVAVQSSSSISG